VYYLFGFKSIGENENLADKFLGEWDHNAGRY
jgi:hypothetical protein